MRTLSKWFKRWPFVLGGVNGDEIEKRNRKLLEVNSVPWRFPRIA